MINEQEYLKNIGRYMDVSTVRADITREEIDEMISIVRNYNCICASPMPWATPYTIQQLADCPDTVVTGVVSFPSGAQTTEMKITQTKEAIAMGCKEIDMVTNISAMLCGDYEYVKNDIRAVVEAAEGVPVKAILEICYLNDDQIRRASLLGVEAGAAYIKTGTGWGPSPTTVDTIRLIRSTIGDAAKIKAAGGVRSLDILLEMANAGCDRFGIGVRSAQTILEDAKNRLK